MSTPRDAATAPIAGAKPGGPKPEWPLATDSISQTSIAALQSPASAVPDSAASDPAAPDARAIPDHPTTPPSRREIMRQLALGAPAAAGYSARREERLASSPGGTAMRRPAPSTIDGLTAPTAVAPLGVIDMNRMAFGPRAGDLDAWKALGSTDDERHAAYVEQQLNPDGIDDSGFEKRLEDAGFQTLDKTLLELWADHHIDDGDDYAWRTLPVWETLRATVLRSVHSKRQLEEVLVDHWHNHFNVFGYDYWSSPLWVSWDRDVIRKHALGNFREMLEDVATSPVMLYYLDNYLNNVAGPNENWARELIELHTLGSENYFGVMPQEDVPGYREGAPVGYVDGDVFEATRCFTGWRINNSTWEDGVGNDGSFLYHDEWHDRFRKMVLGTTIRPDGAAMQDGRDVMDMLAAHPGTARFVCRRLCRRLVSDNPPEALVEQAAAVFANNLDAPDQLAKVVRTILLSGDYKTTWGEKVKRPLETVYGAFRASGAEIDIKDEGLVWPILGLGHAPFYWPAPDGFPDRREAWTSTAGMLGRWRYINLMFFDWYEAITVDVVGQTPNDALTPRAIVDFWVERMLGRPLGAKEHGRILDFASQAGDPDRDIPSDERAERLPWLVALILQSPEFQWR